MVALIRPSQVAINNIPLHKASPHKLDQASNPEAPDMQVMMHVAEGATDLEYKRHQRDGSKNSIVPQLKAPAFNAGSATELQTLLESIDVEWLNALVSESPGSDVYKMAGGNAGHFFEPLAAKASTGWQGDISAVAANVSNGKLAVLLQRQLSIAVVEMEQRHALSPENLVSDVCKIAREVAYGIGEQFDAEATARRQDKSLEQMVEMTLSDRQFAVLIALMCLLAVQKEGYRVLTNAMAEMSRQATIDAGERGIDAAKTRQLGAILGLVVSVAIIGVGLFASGYAAVKQFKASDSGKSKAVEATHKYNKAELAQNNAANKVKLKQEKAGKASRDLDDIDIEAQRTAEARKTAEVKAKELKRKAMDTEREVEAAHIKAKAAKHPDEAKLLNDRVAEAKAKARTARDEAKNAEEHVRVTKDNDKTAKRNLEKAEKRYEAAVAEMDAAETLLSAKKADVFKAQDQIRAIKTAEAAKAAQAAQGGNVADKMSDNGLSKADLQDYAANAKLLGKIAIFQTFGQGVHQVAAAVSTLISSTFDVDAAEQEAEKMIHETNASAEQDLANKQNEQANQSRDLALEILRIIQDMRQQHLATLDFQLNRMS